MERKRRVRLLSPQPKLWTYQVFSIVFVWYAVRNLASHWPLGQYKTRNEVVVKFFSVKLEVSFSSVLESLRIHVSVCVCRCICLSVSDCPSAFNAAVFHGILPIHNVLCLSVCPLRLHGLAAEQGYVLAESNVGMLFVRNRCIPGPACGRALVQPGIRPRHWSWCSTAPDKTQAAHW